MILRGRLSFDLQLCILEALIEQSASTSANPKRS